MVRGALRAQTLFSRLGADVRDYFRDVRAGWWRWPDGGLPPAPGRGGRGDDSAVASDPDRNLSSRRAHARDDDVRDGPDGGAGPRPHARRLDHDQLELALGLFHQRADRRDRYADGVFVRTRP